MNQDLVNEIRQKTDIIDIVGERIPLVSRGKNFFGVCPFHDDSDPSLCVSRDKQIYTCFSCHATGNVFTFLMNYDHIDFKEALVYLGDRLGIDVSNIKVSKKTTKNDKLYAAYNLSVKYYQNNLLSSLGRDARNYLKTRKIDDNLIKEFEVGLSIDRRDDLCKLLTTKGYDLVELNKIGLANDNHDIYNDRIMFPLYDPLGRCVGFSGRIYKDSSQNKYLNTKETEIFKKGEILYHYHSAIEECRKSKSVIVMEGFMDVIRAFSIGVKNTVALMGTALTSEQINLLKRLSKNIILCLDGDSAGVNAALNNGALLLEKGIEVKVVTLPDDDDPDTFILKHGKDRFLNIIDSAINYNDYKINKLKESVDFRSDVEKANYINTVLLETTKVDDDIRVEIVLKKLAKEFDIGYNTLEKRFSDLKGDKKAKTQQILVKKPQNKKDKYNKAIEQIIYFMLNNDWVISQVSNNRVFFPTDKARTLVSEIIYYYEKYGKINVADFYTYVSEKEDILNLLNSILADNYLETTTREELYKYFEVVNEYRQKLEINRLESLMKKEADPIEMAKIVDKIRKLRMGE